VERPHGQVSDRALCNDATPDRLLPKSVRGLSERARPWHSAPAHVVCGPRRGAAAPRVGRGGSCDPGSRCYHAVRQCSRALLPRARFEVPEFAEGTTAMVETLSEATRRGAATCLGGAECSSRDHFSAIRPEMHLDESICAGFPLRCFPQHHCLPLHVQPACPPPAATLCLNLRPQAATRSRRFTRRAMGQLSASLPQAAAPALSCWRAALCPG
jgi:hypothetical protein